MKVVMATKAQKTAKKLEKKLDTIFSQFIRLRDSDDDGNCTCISCGRVGYWEKDDIHNGHFVPRGVKAVRFDENNCHAQCASCNLWREKERVKTQYSLSLLKKIGKKKFEVLAGMGSFTLSPVKQDSVWLQVQIEKYTDKVEKLRKKKLI